MEINICNIFIGLFHYSLLSFLAQVDFFTPMFFRISVAAELAAFALANAAQAASPSPFCRFAPRGYPQCSSSIG